MPLTVAFMIGRDVWERKRGRAVAQYGVQPVLRPFDTENLCWQATVWRSGLWLRASMAFHGHVACVKRAPGASSSTDHSHAVLRLVQCIYVPVYHKNPTKMDKASQVLA
jgi:hypothetical protein